MRLALFDLDGTVLRGNSWHAFYWWSLRRWPGRAPGLLARLLLRRAGLLDARALQQAALGALRGKSAEAVADIGARLFAEQLRAWIRPAARQEMARRRADGCEIALATAAFDFLVRPIAAELDVRHVIATRVAFTGGVCAGHTVRPEPRGAAKAVAVRAHFATEPVDWDRSCAFTDEREDLPLLALVGEPVLVTPLRTLPAGLPAMIRTVDWGRAP